MTILDSLVPQTLDDYLVRARVHITLEVGRARLYLRWEMAKLAAVPFLIVDDLAMRRLPATAAEDLLESIMRRYERVSTLLCDATRAALGSRKPPTTLLST